MVENNNCKAFTTTNWNSKLPSKPQISYFLTINFTTCKFRARNEPSTKVKIKIPKLLAKTVKKKEPKQSDENNINVKKPLVQKVASFFSDAFGRKKKNLLENKNDVTFVSENKSGDRSRNASSKEEGFGSDIQSHENNSDEIFFYENHESENSKLFASTASVSSSDDLSFLEQRVSLASKSSVSESPYGSAKESLEIEEVEEVEQVRLNPSYLTSSFNNKKTPLQITRSSSSTRNRGNSYGGDRGIKRTSSFPAGALKFLMNKHKSRKGYSSGKEMNGKENEADEEKGEGYELCKKRILIGGRCRPLSFPRSPHNGMGISSTRDFPIRALNSD